MASSASIKEENVMVICFEVKGSSLESFIPVAFIVISKTQIYEYG